MRSQRARRRFVEKIDNSQIIMIPGGFSGGDEPDGSAKFITAFFRNPQRHGCGASICSTIAMASCWAFATAFRRSLSSGSCPMVTSSRWMQAARRSPSTTIGRHQSRIVRTRVASNLSPWLSRCEVGDIHTVAISHGEGRFVANDDTLEQLIESGQIATQYVGLDGMPSMDLDVNPNGSVLAIEGITQSGRARARQDGAHRALERGRIPEHPGPELPAAHRRRRGVLHGLGKSLGAGSLANDSHPKRVNRSAAAELEGATTGVVAPSQTVLANPPRDLHASAHRAARLAPSDYRFKQ